MVTENSKPLPGDAALTAAIDGLFDVQSLALAARELVCDMMDSDGALSAGRVMQIAADLALKLAHDLDAAAMLLREERSSLL